MLEDSVYIVAGGGRGIGEASAIALGRYGATVVVNDLGSSILGDGTNHEPAQTTVDAIENAGGHGTVHTGDIASLEYTETLVADVLAEHGRIDGVVNFAGILRDSLSHEMSADDWDDVVRIHLRGHFALYRAIIPHWIEQAKTSELERQRSFVAITSKSALGNVGQLNYSAAKAGILGFVRTAAREVYRHNIRVNALMPTAYTRMIEQIPEHVRPFEEGELPPQKIAPVVAFLLSPAAEGINGCTIRARGDQVGIVSDPEVRRMAIREGGWTLKSLADRFEPMLGGDYPLERSEIPTE